MKKNMGKVDKLIRLLLAILFGVLYFKGIVTGVIGNLLIVVAIIFLVTSMVGFCPLYAIFGINTCSPKSKQ